MTIFYLAAALLIGSALYTYGDSAQAEITSIWERLRKPDSTCLLFLIVLGIWAVVVYFTYY